MRNVQHLIKDHFFPDEFVLMINIGKSQYLHAYL